MDDLKIWVYVIIGVLYLLSRLLKKPEQQPKAEDDLPPTYEPRKPVNPTSSTQPKVLTFEELLKEITEGKQETKPAPRPEYQPVQPKTEYVDYDDDIEPEEKDLEEVDHDYRKKDNIYQVYEEAKKQAFLKPSLEETLDVRNTEMKFGKFKVFEQEQKRNLLQEYTRGLQDPEGLKKAFVMSEILKRKF